MLANGVNTLPALRMARLRNRTVFFAHDVLVRDDRLRLARFGAPAIDVAVAVSDAVAAPLRAIGIPTVVVHNGTAWPVEPAPEIAPSPPVVGCSAVLTEWKGQHVLLEAMTRVTRRDAVLELMGATLPEGRARTRPRSSGAPRSPTSRDGCDSSATSPTRSRGCASGRSRCRRASTRRPDRSPRSRR